MVRTVNKTYDLEYDNLLIHVSKKQMKNMYLRVKDSTGAVYISAPLRTKDSDIIRFVEERREWIEDTTSKIKKREEEKEPEKFLVPFEERELRQKLRRQIQSYIDKYEDIMGVKSTGFTIKKMKTRWGSCNVKTHKLNFNFALAFKDDDLVEYVVVHELTHLLEASHNARFWQLMEHYLPGAKERRYRINHGGK